MNLSLVLYNESGTCKVCDKIIDSNKLEEHYECYKRYQRHEDWYNT